MGNTKKVGTAGRFSSRYGVGVRKRVVAVENKMERHITCPFCGFAQAKRIAPGLYLCKKCEAKFTGGAYEPKTLVGKTISKMVSQKQFAASAQVLETVKESSFSDIEKEVERALNNDNKTADSPRENNEKKSKKKREAVVESETNEEN
jgi:large subunit ribosomal protein L37Ae